MSSNNGQFGLSGGGYWNGSNWIARHTASSQIRTDGDGDISFCANTGLTSGNTFVPSEKVTFHATGYVGINDQTNNARLIIRGNSDNGDHDCQIRIYDTDSTTGSQMPNISFWGGSTEIGGIRSTDNQGMKFYTSNGGTLAEKLIIGPQGAVGIGTDHLLANTSVYNKFAVTGDTTSQLAVAKIVRKNNSASNGTYTFEVDSSEHTSNVANAGAMSVSYTHLTLPTKA